MFDEKLFRELFYDALQIHRREYQVKDERIIKAIVEIQNGYAPKKLGSGCNSKPLNFNDPAYRCGYLHKYASCHASLVYSVVQRIGPVVFENLFNYVPFSKICCIGGGPGTDVIGLCALFCSMPEFCCKVFNFDVVDCMLEWRSAFSSVLAASASFKYGSLGTFLTSCIQSSYLHANMLSCITYPVQESISSADLVTMIKFVSAASSETTQIMLQDVFTLMKPGAAFLFIDNAGGGFYELVSYAAKKCGLANHFGPIRHMKYENIAFKRKMFGFFSLSSTTVAVQMWEKTFLVTLTEYESHLASKQLLDMKSNNMNGSHLRNPANSVGSKKTKQSVQKRASRSAATVCDTNKRLIGSSHQVRKITLDTNDLPHSAHSQATVLKETVEPRSKVLPKNSTTSASEVVRCDQKMPRNSDQVIIHDHFPGIDSNTCRTHTNSFPESDFPMHTTRSRGSKRKNQNETTECCCIVL